MKRIEFCEFYEIDGLKFSIKNDTITYKDYIEFLSRTDLGKQYPKEDFVNRIKTLLANVQICLIARNELKMIIGICFGLTDFAYWLFISDLGIDRRYQKKGIGKKLVEVSNRLAGGEYKIIQITCANEDAIGFYEKIGMRKNNHIMIKSNVEWTEFEVNEEYLKNI